MPIYAYKCDSCGHAQDLLRKISDPPLSTCPACGAETFVKQVTAAGFQLKGSGWYVTDFRDGGKGKSKEGVKDEAKDGAAAPAAESAGDAAKPADGAKAPAAASAGTTAPAPSAAPAAAPAAAPSPTPASGS